MTARKSFNPNTEDGRVILHELRSELQGRRGIVVLKLLALSLPLTSQHSERPFRLLWTLPSEPGGLVQICTPPFTVAKRTPTRGEAVPHFQPSRDQFPEVGKESTESLLSAVVVASKAGLAPAAPRAPSSMQGFAGVPSFPAPPPGVPAGSPPHSGSMHVHSVPVVASAAASGSSSGSGRQPISFRHLAARGPSAAAPGRDPSVHLPAPPATIPVPMHGPARDGFADARSMAAAAYSRGMASYSHGYAGGYHAPPSHGMYPYTYPSHMYDSRFTDPYAAPFPAGDYGEQAPPAPLQDEAMRLPRFPPGAGNALYMRHDHPNFHGRQGAPRASNDSLVGPGTAGPDQVVVKPAFLQGSSSSGPNTSGSAQHTSSGSGHDSRRGAPTHTVGQVGVQRAGRPAHAAQTLQQHVLQGGEAFGRNGALVAKRTRSNASSGGHSAGPAKRPARGYKAPQFAVPSTSGHGAGGSSFYPIAPGDNGFGATSDGGVSLHGLSGPGGAMPGGWAAVPGAMRSSSPAVPNRMPAAMGGAAHGHSQ